QISAALSVNIDELLTSNSDNREAVLRNYLNNLKQLAGEAAIEIANLQRVIAEATAQVETQTGIAQQYDEDFLYNLEPTDDRSIEAYLRSRNQIDQSTITIRSSGQLLNQLGPLNNRLNQLITSIEANFQALAAGIRV